MAELGYLNENLMFTELEKRVKDQTFGNLMLDAYDRPMKPMGNVSKDVFCLIMIRTDTKTLLNASSKCMEIQSLVLEDSFWKAKFTYEFPETGIKEIPSWACEYKGEIDFKKRLQSYPWRRFYTVMHSVIFSLRMYYCNALVQSSSPNISFKITPVDMCTWKCITFVNSKGLKPILMDFNDVIRKLSNSTNSYIFECANSEKCLAKFKSFPGLMDPLVMYLNTVKLCGHMSPYTKPFSYYFTLGYIPTRWAIKDISN